MNGTEVMGCVAGIASVATVLLGAWFVWKVLSILFGGGVHYDPSTNKPVDSYTQSHPDGRVLARGETVQRFPDHNPAMGHLQPRTHDRRSKRGVTPINYDVEVGPVEHPWRDDDITL